MNHTTPPRVQPDRGLVFIYATTLAASAFLLFVVQPIFTRMVLPDLGGAPGVWNACVMWFQAMLLAGYLYAHLMSRVSSARTQVFVHLAVLVVACAVLPLRIAPDWKSPGEGTPILWLVGLLTVSIGPPFFAVCTTAPLLQRWFSRTRHWTASDPYHLYSASNIGGLLALFSYPVLVEPLFGLQAQGSGWSWGYGLLVVMVGLCGFAMLRSQDPGKPKATQTLLSNVAWRTRLHWTALSFVPSGLLLGVTLHITTDIAAVPFFWVVPLGLYILSFVLVFARRQLIKHEWMVALQPWLFILLALTWRATDDLLVQLGLHLAALFVTAMVCHGELAKRRPDPEHLTDFYLWISVGGLLGSVFTVLLAPVLFDSVLEYPLMLVLAFLLRPNGAGGNWRGRSLDLALAALFAVLFLVPRFSGLHIGTIGTLVFYALLGVALWYFRDRPLRFALGMAVMLFVSPKLDDSSRVLAQERTFFGVYRVKTGDEGRINFVYHGSTIHGAQPSQPPFRRDPYVYFHRAGPLGQLFAALEHANKSVRRIGIAGLGIGTIAAYRKPDQTMTFFEIDPAVERIARDTGYFNYLQDYGQNVDVVIGDARLSLAKQPDRYFDLLILDAFTSDAVPIHLITREALALYLRKLSDRGLIVFNTTNRHVRLEPILAALAADAGLAGLVQGFSPTRQEIANGAFPCKWVVLARHSEDLKMLTDPRWQPLSRFDGSVLWTDDYANLFRAVAWSGWLRQQFSFLTRDHDRLPQTR